MELRHLRYFVAVAEERHITRAAERLSMQQPPLSAQIKALEAEVGVRLFHRLPRGVALTEAGAVFFAEAQRILSGVDAMVARTRRVARGQEGRIAIGFTSSVIFHPVVKDSIRQFRAAFPDVSVSLAEDGSGELIDAITANTLDAAFIRGAPAGVEDIRFHDLVEEVMFAAIPEGHPLAIDGSTPVRLRDLGAEPLILYRRTTGPALHDRIIAAFASLGMTPDIVQEAPRVVSTLNLVAAGMGITIVPESLCSSHLEGVVYRPIKSRTKLSAPIRLACRKTDLSKAVVAFVTTGRALAK